LAGGSSAPAMRPDNRLRRKTGCHAGPTLLSSWLAPNSRLVLMRKIHKRIIISSSSGPDTPPAGGTARSLADLFAIPAVVLGAAAGLLLVSAFIAALMVPGGILAFIAWRRYRKLVKKAETDTLEAEYTIIDDPAEPGRKERPD